MKTISKISAVLAIALSSVSFAADGQWELFTGGFGSVDLTLQPASATSYSIAYSSRVTPTIGYNIASGFEFLLTVQLNGGGAATYWNFLGGLAYNFMGNWDEAMFLKAQAGVNILTTAAATASNFAWNVGVGKRFKIVDHVTYAPEIDFVMTNSSTSYLSIVPVQFSMQL
ncbi:MAG: hypothetical protein HYX41_04905 [Bdellovibrio sp.]|nr:hypothetical protein [Bdellovibrio sp.]